MACSIYHDTLCRIRRSNICENGIKYPPFVLRYSFFLVLVFLENKSGNIGLLWHNNDTNASFYAGRRSLTSSWVISANNMSIICTNKFDTSMFKLATEFTIFFSSTTSRTIIKYQHLGKFETFWMAHYIIKHCSFERPVLSVVVRTKLVTNRTLCYFILINIFTLAKINVYTCSIFNSPSIVILIVLDGCYGLLWPFYLLFLWVCCVWFKQYRQKCIFVRCPKKSHESLDFDLVFQEYTSRGQVLLNELTPN